MYKKINSLKSSVVRKPIKKPVSYLNLSDEILSEDQHKNSTLGPKYIFGGKFDIKTVIADCENITQSVESNTKDEMCGIVHNNIKKFFKQPLRSKEKKSNNLNQIQKSLLSKPIKQVNLQPLIKMNRMWKCRNALGE